jgi:hypothetical protein
MSDCYGGLLRYDIDSHFRQLASTARQTFSLRSHSNALPHPQTRLLKLVFSRYHTEDAEAEDCSDAEAYAAYGMVRVWGHLDQSQNSRSRRGEGALR